MPIKSRPLGGVILTDKDWDRFVSQTKDAKPDKELAAVIREGRKLLDIYKKNGGVVPMRIDSNTGKYIPVSMK